MLAEAPLWLQEWARSRNAAAQPPSVKAELGEPPPWVSKFENRGLAKQNLNAHTQQLPERLRTTDVQVAAEILPNPDLPWDPWNNMLMLFRAASDGEALDAAHTFSKKSRKYDPAATESEMARDHQITANAVACGLARLQGPGDCAELESAKPTKCGAHNLQNGGGNNSPDGSASNDDKEGQNQRSGNADDTAHESGDASDSKTSG